MAMVFVLLTYGGWNEAAYISAELKDQQRSMVRALVVLDPPHHGALPARELGLLVRARLRRHGQVGGHRRRPARRAFGNAGGVLIAALVAVAALTSINATMIVGARTNFAVGRDWPLLERFGQWDESSGTPRAALLVQGIAALLLVGVGALAGGGFRSMVEFTAPVFWLFFLLAGLRCSCCASASRTSSGRSACRSIRSCRSPSCVVCAYMLWSSLSYVYSQALGGLNAAWVGVAVLAVGAVLLLVVRSCRAGRPFLVIPSRSGAPHEHRLA